MAKVSYNGKEYDSKAEIIRELYESGKLKNESYSKNQIAKELDVAVQTVHATLMKVIRPQDVRIDKPKVKIEKIKSVSVKGKSSEVIILHGNEEAVGINNKKKIEVNWAPNPWNLPITNPPTFVIDPGFKGDIPWVCENENCVSDLIQY